MLPSGRERRALAKKLGLKKKKESFKEMMQRFTRSQEMGKMIHEMNLQYMENQRLSNDQKEESEKSEFEKGPEAEQSQENSDSKKDDQE